MGAHVIETLRGKRDDDHIIGADNDVVAKVAVAEFLVRDADDALFVCAKCAAKLISGLGDGDVG